MFSDLRISGGDGLGRVKCPRARGPGPRVPLVCGEAARTLEKSGSRQHLQRRFGARTPREAAARRVASAENRGGVDGRR